MTGAEGEIEVLEFSAPAVLARLHGQCFERPWTEQAFSDLSAMPGAICLTALVQGQPAGFVLARQVADEAEILTMCVIPAARRRGIARQLVALLLERLDKVHALFLEVDAQNAPAQRLYEQFGFKQAGVRKGYYARTEGAATDALLLRREMRESVSAAGFAKV